MQRESLPAIWHWNFIQDYLQELKSILSERLDEDMVLFIKRNWTLSMWHIRGWLTQTVNLDAGKRNCEAHSFSLAKR